MCNELRQTLSRLRELENEYFKEFNKCYPSFYDESKGGVFGPSHLYEMAIEAEVLLTGLGKTAVKRLMYVGFDLLFPFNNPVDWYSWKEMVKEKNISHTIYFSISTRIATEFKRIELHLDNDTWDGYCTLDELEFSISKDRYAELFLEKIKERRECPETDALRDEKKAIHNISINEFTYNEKTESEAVNHLDELNKRTGIWANVATAASIIMKLTGTKT